ncbi:hypothetical protein [Mycolicibacterium fortuitum]|uniref:Proline rich protein n=2 Tax=Mycolicibacterium fortuitum TaxID=1766 RepID=K0V7D2_MYCFO|nr:hypothetical protein [Mycolicibacterium fortuitum]AIY49350.2 conserved hypothetical proline rich protein [Mycobacterium sp. VKM Ac-1817D]CRL76427.1 hypothetical proline rich protein [Mycolicibacter nonchromogenicus]ALI25935.1 VgrG protein [Mycolicibacterium fortuitum]EJZ15127.1 hypothetical protein MFORT_06384 [Mycolicibacterium fortuitum subsp. fortuitum DSM 46621 = ATCC 6841 = JCM 6387]MBP3082059.1 hypothetical protein [Mycolicibacterium fortuitum]
MKLDFTKVTDAATKLWRSRLGRLRTSTVVLIVAFVALSWVQQEYRPAQPAAPAPGTQVVPPGFVPDPDYTWVPRTKLQTPRSTTPTETPEPTETTTTTTTTTETTTPTEPVPGESTTPTTTPLPGAPRTTVIDPDGPGLIPPITLPLGPAPAPPPPAEQPLPGQEPVAPTLPR